MIEKIIGVWYLILEWKNLELDGKHSDSTSLDANSEEFDIAMQIKYTNSTRHFWKYLLTKYYDNFP